MARLEQFGRESSAAGIETHGMPLDAWQVQGALMLFAHKEAHRGEPDQPAINLADLSQNDLTVESAARDEWVAEQNGNPSLAVAFRAYQERHSHERVDVQNTDMLEELLAGVTKEKEEIKRASRLH